MAEEIDFENCHFCYFKSHMTLTLTSDDLQSDIFVNNSSTLSNTTIWFVAALSLIVDVWMDIHTDVCMDGRTFYRVYRRWPKRLSLVSILYRAGFNNYLFSVVREDTMWSDEWWRPAVGIRNGV